MTADSATPGRKIAARPFAYQPKTASLLEVAAAKAMHAHRQNEYRHKPDHDEDAPQGGRPINGDAIVVLGFIREKGGATTRDVMTRFRWQKPRAQSSVRSLQRSGRIEARNHNGLNVWTAVEGGE